VSTREDLSRFRALEIDFSSIGLEQSAGFEPYFCTPEGSEHMGSIGCDGVHFILLPGDERVFCVDPAMGEEGTFVLPVGADFREFLSFLLYCRDANPLSQIWWMTEEQFRGLLVEDEAARESGDMVSLAAAKDAALSAVQQEFELKPADPYAKIKTLQEVFDPVGLTFPDEYYEILGLENPRGTVGSSNTYGQFAEIHVEIGGERS
jgi:hypothetical protein